MLDFKSYYSSSRGNLNLCSDGTTTLLLDIGVPFGQVKKALNFRTSDIDGALISHSHRDHCKGVPGALKAGLDCYMLEHTIKDLRVSGHRVHAVIPKESFVVGTFTIMPFHLQHDVDNAGYLLASGGSKMVYITDTYYCKYMFKGVNIFAVECNYDAGILDGNIDAGIVPPALRHRIERSHFSLENVKKFFRANDLTATKEIHLLHLSEVNGHPELFKTAIQKITGKPVYIGGKDNG